jgi:hypothetical protein
LKQDHKIVAPALDVVDIIGAKLSPVIMDFFSKLLPFGRENIEMH